VVLVLFFVIAGVEAALSLGAQGLAGGPQAVGWRIGLIERFAVSPAVLDYALRGEVGLWPRFVLYAFVHQGALHAIFAGVLLLALGKFVAEGMGQLRALPRVPGGHGARRGGLRARRGPGRSRCSGPIRGSTG
jgi:hypothetical protein